MTPLLKASALCTLAALSFLVTRQLPLRHPSPSPASTPIPAVIHRYAVIPTIPPNPEETAVPTPPPDIAAVIPPPSPPTPRPLSTPQPVTVSKPFLNDTLFVYRDTAVQQTVDQWRSTRPSDAQKLSYLANQPEAVWFGDWDTDITTSTKQYVDAASAANALPVLVTYNIPNRDCGGYAAGGSDNPTAYLNWIQGFAKGVGKRRAIIIVEPDAIPGMECLSSTEQSDRLNLIKQTVSILKSETNAAVYLDAGNPHWIAAEEMANRLKQAGIAEADGFTLNVSNFFTTEENTSFGESISRLVSNKHFIIDTSRNGSGPAPDLDWCNPPGRSLGTPPTLNVNNPLIDALLWIKNPGDSDGSCNGSPGPSGTWWPEYALALIK